MEIGPEGLRVREESVEACGERGAPEVGGRPAECAELGGGGEGEAGGLEHGEEVDEEETTVGDHL